MDPKELLGKLKTLNELVTLVKNQPRGTFDFSEVLLIAIQQLQPDTIGLFQACIEIDISNFLVNGKIYSTYNDAETQLESLKKQLEEHQPQGTLQYLTNSGREYRAKYLGANFTEIYDQEIKDLLELANETLAKETIKKKIKIIVVLDDGAKAVRILMKYLKQWSNLQSRIIYAVEQTMNGLYNTWKKVHEPDTNVARRIPITAIANSHLKCSLESSYIAEMVLTQLLPELAEAEKLSPSPKYGIIGYGNIGQQIYAGLRDLANIPIDRIIVCEMTKPEGIINKSLVELIGECHYIFGCTGCDTIAAKPVNEREEIFKIILQNRKIHFISCSSGNVEFFSTIQLLLQNPNTFYKKIPPTEAIDSINPDPLDDIICGNVVIHYGGYPINFRVLTNPKVDEKNQELYRDKQLWRMDLIMSALFAGIVQTCVQNSSSSPQLFKDGEDPSSPAYYFFIPLHPSFQQYIVFNWINLWGADLAYRHSWLEFGQNFYEQLNSFHNWDEILKKSRYRHNTQITASPVTETKQVTIEVAPEIFGPDIRSIIDPVLSDIQKSFTDNLKKIAIVIALRKYYETKCKDLITFEASLDESSAVSPIANSYVNLAIVSQSEALEKEQHTPQPFSHDELLQTYETIYTPKTPIEIEKLFECQRNETAAPHKLLLLGRAGIGKTTVCQYMVDRWREKKLWDQKFEMVIWIELKKLKDLQHSMRRTRIRPATTTESDQAEQLLVNYLINILKQYATLPIRDSIFIDYLKAQKNHILFILDGYDEVSDEVNDKETILHKTIAYISDNFHLIVTSRPYSSPLNSNSDIKFDRQLENIGFTNDNIKNYVRLYFVNVPDGAEQATQLISTLKQNLTLWGMAHVPINLALLCWVWKTRPDHIPSDASITDIYYTLVDMIYDRCESKRIRLTMRGASTQPITMPSADIAGIYIFLKELAFRSFKDKQLIISDNILTILTDEQKALLNQVLKTGLLTKSGHEGDSDPKTNQVSYYFIHLTFQEFFVAQYIVDQLNSTHAHEDIIHFLEEKRTDDYYEIVWWFVSGLLKDSPIWQEVINILQKQPDYPIEHRHRRFRILVRCIEENKRDEQEIPQEYLDWIRWFGRKEFLRLAQANKNNDINSLRFSIVQSLALSPQVLRCSEILNDAWLEKIMKIDQPLDYHSLFISNIFLALGEIAVLDNRIKLLLASIRTFHEKNRPSVAIYALRKCAEEDKMTQNFLLTFLSTILSVIESPQEILDIQLSALYALVQAAKQEQDIQQKLLDIFSSDRTPDYLKKNIACVLGWLAEKNTDILRYLLSIACDYLDGKNPLGPPNKLTLEVFHTGIRLFFHNFTELAKIELGKKEHAYQGALTLLLKMATSARFNDCTYDLRDGKYYFDSPDDIILKTIKELVEIDRTTILALLNKENYICEQRYAQSLLLDDSLRALFILHVPNLSDLSENDLEVPPETPFMPRLSHLSEDDSKSTLVDPYFLSTIIHSLDEKSILDSILITFGIFHMRDNKLKNKLKLLINTNRNIHQLLSNIIKIVKFFDTPEIHSTHSAFFFTHTRTAKKTTGPNIELLYKDSLTICSSPDTNLTCTRLLEKIIVISALAVVAETNETIRFLLLKMYHEKDLSNMTKFFMLHAFAHLALIDDKFYNILVIAQNYPSSIQLKQAADDTLAYIRRDTDRVKQAAKQGLRYLQTCSPLSPPKNKLGDEPKSNYGRIFRHAKNIRSTMPTPILQIAGLTYQPFPRNDHCLYQAVTCYLRHGEDVQFLRNIVADNLRTNIEQYRDLIPLPPEHTLEDYITDIQGTNAWAKDVEGCVLMWLLERPIVVIDYDGKICNQQEIAGFSSENPIFVYQDGIDHYGTLLLDGTKEAKDILTALVQLSESSHTNTM